jgi:hypothetical protein
VFWLSERTAGRTTQLSAGMTPVQSHHSIGLTAKQKPPGFPGGFGYTGEDARIYVFYV